MLEHRIRGQAERGKVRKSWTLVGGGRTSGKLREALIVGIPWVEVGELHEISRFHARLVEY